MQIKKYVYMYMYSKKKNYPGSPKTQKLHFGSRELLTRIILQIILCLVSDCQGIYVYIYIYVYKQSSCDT